jgi:acetyl esterase/lipase
MPDSREVLTRPAPPPDLTLTYGPHPDHVIDVRLPPSRPAPLIVMIHGGFWRAAYDRTHTGPLTSALAAAGYVVAIPEFRRTGQEGGGWPGTFDDVAAALEAVPDLLAPYSEDPPVLLGHSAGGHLAVWAATHLNSLLAGSKGPSSLNPSSLNPSPLSASHPNAADPGGDGLDTDRPDAGHLDPGRSDTGHPHTTRSDPGRSLTTRSDSGRSATARPDTGHHPAARIQSVVSLAGCLDLAMCSTLGLDNGATDLLIGGPPSEVPDRYAHADPAQLPRPAVPVTLLHGTTDDRVPIEVSRSYAERTGVPLRELPGMGHFALIDPLTAAWPHVLAALSQR